MQFVLLGALLIIIRSASCLEARGNNYEVLQPNGTLVSSFCFRRFTQFEPVVFTALPRAYSAGTVAE